LSKGCRPRNQQQSYKWRYSGAYGHGKTESLALVLDSGLSERLEVRLARVPIQRVKAFSQDDFAECIGKTNEEIIQERERIKMPRPFGFVKGRSEKSQNFDHWLPWCQGEGQSYSAQSDS